MRNLWCLSTYEFENLPHPPRSGTREGLSHISVWFIHVFFVHIIVAFKSKFSTAERNARWERLNGPLGVKRPHDHNWQPAGGLVRKAPRAHVPNNWSEMWGHR